MNNDVVNKIIKCQNIGKKLKEKFAIIALSVCVKIHAMREVI